MSYLELATNDALGQVKHEIGNASDSAKGVAIGGAVPGRGATSRVSRVHLPAVGITSTI
jgi:hypothetical protein